MDLIQLTQRVSSYTARWDALQKEDAYLSAQLDAAMRQMDSIQKAGELLIKGIDAVKRAKPLLSATSMERCEALANSAIKAVFDFPYTVEYSPDTGRFMLNKGDYSTDLASSEGGGLLAVISFVFGVYLLVKLGKRRILFMDEHFTQISSSYLPRFIEFLQVLCKDLGADILLVTHDQRIDASMVDHAYLVEDGTASKIK